MALTQCQLSLDNDKIQPWKQRGAPETEDDEHA